MKEGVNKYVMVNNLMLRRVVADINCYYHLSNYWLSTFLLGSNNLQ